ncbi:MAG: quinolinate synthase NadA [Oscillospiraceae bacterium]|nr:quinolinate synthase NadA [Oscillospiraceae bacterium]
MKISEVQAEIIRLKKERGICILAHSYQAREIIEIADFTGDSFQLSLAAAENTTEEQKIVLMCGVRFMAETVKILSPEKTVFLANPEAGCPMAEQMDKELVEAVKIEYPGYTVVAYINTTAELKTVCDVCVTSSSAVKIVGKIENDNILFLPDCNLGAYVAEKLPHKNIKLLQGGCPIHAVVDVNDVKRAQSAYPKAKLLVHPECVPAVVSLADYAGSTSGIIEHAIKSEIKEFLIGTEMSIAEHLQYLCPDKKFYCLSQKLLCPNMKVTTLVDVLNCVRGTGGEEIVMDSVTIAKAKVCIDEMIKLNR